MWCIPVGRFPFSDNGEALKKLLFARLENADNYVWLQLHQSAVTASRESEIENYISVCHCEDYLGFWPRYAEEQFQLGHGQLKSK